jgi:hypothetical protein
MSNVDHVRPGGLDLDQRHVGVAGDSDFLERIENQVRQDTENLRRLDDHRWEAPGNFTPNDPTSARTMSLRGDLGILRAARETCERPATREARLGRSLARASPSHGVAARQEPRPYAPRQTGAFNVFIAQAHSGRPPATEI